MKVHRFESFLNKSASVKKITEDADGEDYETLRGMGLTDPLDFFEALSELVDEWGSDPEVNSALETLQRKKNDLMKKWIDFSHDEEFQSWVEAAHNDVSLDELGVLEFMIATDY